MFPRAGPGHVQRWTLGWTRAIFRSTPDASLHLLIWWQRPVLASRSHGHRAREGGEPVPSCRYRSREGGPHVPCAVLVWFAMVSSLQITSRLSHNHHSGPRSCPARGGDDGEQAVLLPLSGSRYRDNKTKINIALRGGELPQERD